MDPLPSLPAPPSIARPRRGNPWLPATSAVLFAFVLAMVLIQKLFPLHGRFASDVNLVQELAAATFVEENLPPVGAGWPQWLGPERNGTAREPDLLVKWPARGPKRLWKVPGGAGFSCLAVRQGRAYTLFAQNDREVVICWDTGGKEVWRHTYEAPYPSPFRGPRSTPTLDGDRLYTVGATGVFHCLDAATGHVNWKHDLLSELGAKNLEWGLAFSPLVEGDLVYTCPGEGDASLVAFNKHTGEQVWSAGKDKAGYSSPVAATVEGVRQIVVFTGKSILGVAADGGKLLWRQPWETEYDVNAATPLVIHARADRQPLTYVFVSSGYHKGCGLFKIAGDGRGHFHAQPVYTSNRLCAHFATPLRYRDHVYGFNEGELVCMDLRSGEVRWAERGFHKGSLLRVDDRMIVLGEQGQLALFEPSPKGFQQLAKCRPFTHRTWTMPSLADGRLYLRDEEEVLCLDVRRPKE
jgi:outer membrane protein assembly factor BamB